MKRSIGLVAVAVVLAMTFGLSNLAAAQSDAVLQIYVSAANVPTNVPGIYTYVAPPKDFNILTATDAELATHGFPQRPDRQADAEHYRLWERAMIAAKIPWNGQLKSVPLSNREAMSASLQSLRPAPASPTPGAATSASSLNWSGVALTNKLKSFNSLTSFTDIYSVFTVPTSQPPFGAGCDVYQQLTWVGLDGYAAHHAIQPGGGAALQGGLISLTNCSSSDAIYDAVIGWEPAYFNLVFTVKAGDVMYVEVSDGLGGTNPGTIFIEDLTTLTYNSYSVAYPGGPGFVGESAEWIVERYCCRNSGYPYPSINTIGIFFDGGAALTGNGHVFYPGSSATSTAVITMRDDGDTQDISIVNHGSSGFEGQHGLWFQNVGCAFTPGCIEK